MNLLPAWLPPDRSALIWRDVCQLRLENPRKIVQMLPARYLRYLGHREMTNPTWFGSPRQRSLGALLTCCLSAACGGTAVRDDERAAAGARGNPVGSAGAGGEAATGNAGADQGGAAGEAMVRSVSLARRRRSARPACPARRRSQRRRAQTKTWSCWRCTLRGASSADQATYDRVVRDVGAIRGQDERVAGIQYFPHSDGKSVGLTPDAATYAVMHAGQYRAWDCLNQTYVVTNTLFVDEKPPFESNVVLTLKGIYDIKTVVMQYGGLVGVKAYGAGLGGDGPTICVTRESDLWHYVFDQAGGECPSGCTEHTYYHFTTTAAGAVASLGEIPDTGDSPYTSNEACH